MKKIDQAIAYLKGSLPDDGQPTVKLSPEDDPVVRPYLEQLHICYLADKGHAYEYIQNRHLKEDGISIDELHKIGLQNLRLLASKRDSRVQPYGNIFAFLMGGDFEASIMLLDEFWNEKFLKYVNSSYAVAIPARDVLAFCDIGSKTGIAELQALINRIWPSKNHLVSDKIYIRYKGGWKPNQ